MAWRRAVKMVATHGWVGILCLLGLSLVALALAPLNLDNGYSLIENTISEGAGQGVEGAWLSRVGLLMLGCAITWLSVLAVSRWGTAGTLLLGTLGVLMISATVFSSRSWLEEARFDQTEDLLHRLAAFAMGVAFIVGVLSVSRQREAEIKARYPDLLTVVAATGFSLGILSWSEVQGLMQRLMFLVGYAWFTWETLMLRSSRGGPEPPT